MRVKFNANGNGGVITRNDAMDLRMNNAKRMPVVLLLDTSFSMNWKDNYGDNSKIEDLNRAVNKMYEFIRSNPKLKESVELCVIPFNSKYSIEDDFSLITHKAPASFKAKGTTNMSGPIMRALDLIEKRKRSYRENGIHCYRPSVILLTDGGVFFTDRKAFELAKGQVRREVAGKHLHFVARQIVGGNSHADRKNLELLQGFDWEIPAARLDTSDFTQFFMLVSNSLEQVSNSNDKIDPDGGDAFVKSINGFEDSTPIPEPEPTIPLVKPEYESYEEDQYIIE